MWNWFNCYLSGRHEFGVWCEPGAIFLRCVHCGKRSQGWQLDPRAVAALTPPRAHVTASPTHVTPPQVAPPAGRVVRFERTAAR